LATKPDSQTLYALCRSANPAEVHEGFQRLGGYLLVVARSTLNAVLFDQSVVEDSVQEALKDIWLRLSRDQGPEKADYFYSWALSIVNHKCIDKLRSVQRHRTTSLEEVDHEEDMLPVGDTESEYASYPEQLVLLNEMKVKLLLDLHRHPKLSEDSRVVLVQGFLFEKTDAELAALLGVAQPNIRLIRHRNLQKLRQDVDWIAEIRA
jgi:RNA polymerase sigma factor (sigma-70 family)